MSSTAETTDASPGILAIFNNVAPGREAEFEEWFQHEHLAERIAVPGFLIGRRHEAISGQPRYFNFYVTQSVGVLKSAAYLGRLDEPTPMTRTVMSEIFKDMIRTVCRRTFRLGVMRGTGVVTVRFGERPAETALQAAIETMMRDKAVACGEIWQAADALEFPVSHGRAPARRRSQDRGVPAGGDAARAGRRDDRSSAGERVSTDRDRSLSAALRNQGRRPPLNDDACGLSTAVSTSYFYRRTFSIDHTLLYQRPEKPPDNSTTSCGRK